MSRWYRTGYRQCLRHHHYQRHCYHDDCQQRRQDQQQYERQPTENRFLWTGIIWFTTNLPEACTGVKSINGGICKIFASCSSYNNNTIVVLHGNCSMWIIVNHVRVAAQKMLMTGCTRVIPATTVTVAKTMNSIKSTHCRWNIIAVEYIKYKSSRILRRGNMLNVLLNPQDSWNILN